MSPKGIRRIRRTIRRTIGRYPDFQRRCQLIARSNFARFVAELVNVPCTDTHFYFWNDLLVCSVTASAKKALAAGLDKIEWEELKEPPPTA
jgi:hypothetical protein